MLRARCALRGEAQIARRPGSLEGVKRRAILQEVAIEQVPLIAELVVESQHVLVERLILFGRRGEVVLPGRGASDVGQRHEREELQGRGADPIGGNLVAGKRQAVERIANHPREAAEVAGSFLGRGHDGLAGQAPAQPEPFEGPEEEGAVLREGSAERSAVLVLRQGRRIGGGKIILRLEAIVSIELPHAAVQRVGARLGDHLHNRPGVAAEFGGEVARLDLEFLDGVDVRPRLHRVTAERHIGHAVELEVVRVLPLPMHDVVHIRRRLSPRRHAGGQQPQAGEIAAAQRQLENLFLCDDLADRRRGGLHGDARGHDRDGFVQVAELQDGVDARGLVHLHGDRTLGVAPEAD